MTNDELQALCESNAKAIQSFANATSTAFQQTITTLDRVVAQQATTADEIDTLLGAVSTNEVGVRTLVEQRAESDRRFEVLRLEAVSDRQRADQKFEVMQENIQNLLLELARANQRIEQLEQAD